MRKNEIASGKMLTVAEVEEGLKSRQE